MAFTFPLSLPSVGGIRSITLRVNSNDGLSQSPFTFEQEIQAGQGELLLADVELIPMRRAAAEEWVAFLMALRGRYGTLLMGDPVNTSPRGTWAGTPLINGSHAIGARTLAIDGFTAGATGKAGDWMQFGSGATSQLRKVLQDFTANGSGQANVEIGPKLNAALSDDAPIVTSSPKGVWRLTSNERQWSIQVAQIYGLSFSCMEAL
jgi:hypothetical protein